MTQPRDPFPIRNVLVVGAGTMGNGIAQVVAEAGIETVLCDADQGQLASGLRAIENRWERLLSSGKKSSDQIESARGVLRAGTIDDAARVGLVIEAIVEDVDAKAGLFSQLAAVAAPDTLFASNTSSLSVTYLGRASGRPDRFAGLHFFNPVPVLPLVEVVRGLGTSDSTVAALTAFAAAIGKQPVTVSDAPGFVANRLLLPMINEAIFALQEGVADAESIDRVMKLGAAHPMGPLALADLIGLDVCLAIMETLQRDFGDDKYRPAPLLRRMVAAGRLGRKSGVGFFVY
jgi:3-hydroxybutyryl-CoA dehydrogenase